MQATTIVSCRDLQRYNIGIFATAAQRPGKRNAPVSDTAHFPLFYVRRTRRPAPAAGTAYLPDDPIDKIHDLVEILRQMRNDPSIRDRKNTAIAPH